MTQVSGCYAVALVTDYQIGLMKQIFIQMHEQQHRLAELTLYREFHSEGGGVA